MVILQMAMNRAVAKSQNKSHSTYKSQQSYKPQFKHTYQSQYDQKYSGSGYSSQSKGYYGDILAAKK